MTPPVPKQPKAVLVPKQLTVHCPENEALSRFFLEKWRSMMDQPGVLWENLYRTFASANRNLCASKEPIRTLHDFSNTKGVGQWLVRIMKGFFEQSSQDLLATKGNKSSGTKAYVPRKNSSAYAILITLHSGKKSMPKEVLIDAAEASGLSQGAIGPDKYKGKHSSPKDWYTGWSCMKALQSKGLIVKLTKPLRYSLTPEGHATACECLSRAGLDGSAESLDIASGHDTSAAIHSSEHHSMGHSVADTMSTSCMTNAPNITVASHSPETACGSSATKRPYYYNAEVQSKGSTEFSKLDKDAIFMDNFVLAVPPRQSNESFLEAYEVVLILDNRENFGSRSRKVADNIFSQFQVPVEVKHLPVGDGIWIARDRKIGEEYVLDLIVERKNVSDLHGSITDNRYKDQKLRVKVKRLPVGDGIWVTRRGKDGTGYVLDYIVERKNLLDLDDSVTDNIYRDQKLRLQRCGLRKLIYLVEGITNVSEKAKTACFTTEVLDGFDIRRTSGYAETERHYVYLTSSTIEYCKTNFSNLSNTVHVCLTYNEFERRCKDFDKSTVSQIFALQLMQVPQVTEEAALAVIELYPSLISLARAYSTFDGDTRAQEMLQKKSNKINAGASRNIFKLVSAEG